MKAGAEGFLHPLAAIILWDINSLGLPSVLLEL